MPLYTQSNISSLHAQRTFRRESVDNYNHITKLSSGMRINSAADDPSNMQVSNRITTQINGLYQGNRNSNEGIAFLNEAEGSLCEDLSMLQRIRQLAIQSANGVYSSVERQAMQDEVVQLCNEITKIGFKTTYGGEQMLNGAGNGLIRANGTVDLHVGANTNDTITLHMSVAYTMSAMYIELGGFPNGGFSTTDQSFDITSMSKAEYVIDQVDRYIGFVDKKRSEMGALINRLESSIRNQEVGHEKHSSTRAQIRDADYAQETSNYISNQTLINATTQMMVQANARPEVVAALLSN